MAYGDTTLDLCWMDVLILFIRILGAQTAIKKEWNSCVRESVENISAEKTPLRCLLNYFFLGELEKYHFQPEHSITILFLKSAARS